MPSTPSVPSTALVIGGGIAGPAVAMFLGRAGINPVIYEGRPGPADDTGAFLNLAPNGLAVLETLGLAWEIAARGSRPRASSFSIIEANGWAGFRRPRSSSGPAR